MIKKEIYPKTKRIPVIGAIVELTEKLDGSNLVFFKKALENDGTEVLFIAQRKNIYMLQDIDEVKDICYKGLYQWLKENGEYLEEHLHKDSAICGEWLGMGTLKYDIGEFDKRWYMFAKANIDDDFNLYNLNYDHDLFIYPFDNQIIPSFLGIVPVVSRIRNFPNKEQLDSIYDKYAEKHSDRKVEGFVINCNNMINKYVRMKNGKLVEYSDNDHKGDK